MALPIAAVVGALAGTAKAATTGVVTGTIKAALKRAASAAAEEVIKTGIKEGTKAALKQATSKEFLAKLAKKQFSDAQATLINRLKTTPSKALYDYVARDLGTDVDNIRGLVKAYRQTPKMRELATGKPFRDAATKALKNQLNLPKKPRIVDIIRHARERAAKEIRTEEKDGKRYEKYWNRQVAAKLKEIEDRLREKVHGVSNAEDEFKTAQKLKNMKISRQRNSNFFNETTIFELEDVIDGLENDIEQYIPGSNESIILIEYEPHKWSVHSRKAVQAYIDDVQQTIDVIVPRK